MKQFLKDSYKLVRCKQDAYSNLGLAVWQFQITTDLVRVSRTHIAT